MDPYVVINYDLFVPNVISIICLCLHLSVVLPSLSNLRGNFFNLTGRHDQLDVFLFIDSVLVSDLLARSLSLCLSFCLFLSLSISISISPIFLSAYFSQMETAGPYLSLVVVTRHDTNPSLFNTKFRLNFG